MVKIDENIQSGKKVVVKKQTLLTRLLVTLFLMLGLFVVAAVITYLPTLYRKANPERNYDWCSKSGGVIDKNSYPSVCTAKDGSRYIQPISMEEEKLLESPVSNQPDKK